MLFREKHFWIFDEFWRLLDASILTGFRISSPAAIVDERRALREPPGRREVATRVLVLCPALLGLPAAGCEPANFRGLILRCIEAKFCKKICV